MQKEIRNHLIELSDEKYKKFHSTLCPETKNILGVRAPILKKYAKELYSDYKAEIIEVIGNEYYEEILLQGLIIGQLTSVKSTKKYLKKFIPKINNWAVCDMTCAGLKIVKKNREEFIGLIKKCLSSKSEFEIRFGLVMLLDYYVDDEYIDEVLQISGGITSEDYYVKMANAWLISVCLIKYYDKTKVFLRDCNLDDFTYNKALQKAIESYRITDSQKNELRKMKRNNKN